MQSHDKAMVPLAKWRETNSIPKSSFYFWQKDGLMPKVTRIGNRMYITAEDDAAWRESLRNSNKE